MRILIDTNVYLDYLLTRDGVDDVINFFELTAKVNNQIYVTSMSIRDIGYVMHRKLHDEKLAKKAQELVYQMSNKIIDITADDTINSIYGEMKDFEDSLISEAAEREMLDAIVTTNVKDFVGANIPVYSVSKMNSILSQQLKYQKSNNNL